MTKQIVLAAAIALLSQSSFASILTPQPGTKSVEGINVASTADASIDGQTQKLTTLGAGLRTKKVVVVTELGEGRGEGLAVRFACRGQQSGKQHNMLSANVDSEARPKEIEFVITRDGVGRVAGKLVKQFG